MATKKTTAPKKIHPIIEFTTHDGKSGTIDTNKPLTDADVKTIKDNANTIKFINKKGQVAYVPPNEFNQATFYDIKKTAISYDTKFGKEGYATQQIGRVKDLFYQDVDAVKKAVKHPTVGNVMGVVIPPHTRQFANAVKQSGLKSGREFMENVASPIGAAMAANPSMGMGGSAAPANKTYSPKQVTKMGEDNKKIVKHYFEPKEKATEAAIVARGGHSVVTGAGHVAETVLEWETGTRLLGMGKIIPKFQAMAEGPAKETAKALLIKLVKGEVGRGEVVNQLRKLGFKELLKGAGRTGTTAFALEELKRPTDVVNNAVNAVFAGVMDIGISSTLHGFSLSNFFTKLGKSEGTNLKIAIKSFKDPKALDETIKFMADIEHANLPEMTVDNIAHGIVKLKEKATSDAEYLILLRKIRKDLNVADSGEKVVSLKHPIDYKPLDVQMDRDVTPPEVPPHPSAEDILPTPMPISQYKPLDVQMDRDLTVQKPVITPEQYSGPRPEQSKLDTATDAELDGIIYRGIKSDNPRSKVNGERQTYVQDVLDVLGDDPDAVYGQLLVDNHMLNNTGNPFSKPAMAVFLHNLDKLRERGVPEETINRLAVKILKDCYIHTADPTNVLTRTFNDFIGIKDRFNVESRGTGFQAPAATEPFNVETSVPNNYQPIEPATGLDLAGGVAVMSPKSSNLLGEVPFFKQTPEALKAQLDATLEGLAPRFKNPAEYLSFVKDATKNAEEQGYATVINMLRDEKAVDAYINFHGLNEVRMVDVPESLDVQMNRDLNVKKNVIVPEQYSGPRNNEKIELSDAIKIARPESSDWFIDMTTKAIENLRSRFPKMADHTLKEIWELDRTIGGQNIPRNQFDMYVDLYNHYRAVGSSHEAAIIAINDFAITNSGMKEPSLAPDFLDNMPPDIKAKRQQLIDLFDMLEQALPDDKKPKFWENMKNVLDRADKAGDYDRVIEKWSLMLTVRDAAKKAIDDKTINPNLAKDIKNAPISKSPARFELDPEFLEYYETQNIYPKDKRLFDAFFPEARLERPPEGYELNSPSGNATTKFIGNRIILGLNRAATAFDVVHELFHAFDESGALKKDFSKAIDQSIRKLVGDSGFNPDGSRTVAGREAAANLFAAYLTGAKTDSPKLNSAFQAMQNEVIASYLIDKEAITNPAARTFMESLLTDYDKINNFNTYASNYDTSMKTTLWYAKMKASAEDWKKGDGLKNKLRNFVNKSRAVLYSDTGYLKGIDEAVEKIEAQKAIDNYHYVDDLMFEGDKVAVEVVIYADGRQVVSKPFSASDEYLSGELSPTADGGYRFAVEVPPDYVPPKESGLFDKAKLVSGSSGKAKKMVEQAIDSFYAGKPTTKFDTTTGDITASGPSTDIRGMTVDIDGKPMGMATYISKYLAALRAKHLFEERGVEIGDDLRGYDDVINHFDNYLDNPSKEIVLEKQNLIYQIHEDLLNYLISHDVITKEMAANFEASNPLYVPFHRIFEASEVLARPLKLGRTAPAPKAIKGSQRPVDDVIHNTMLNLYAFTIAADRNKFYRDVFSTLEENGMMGESVTANKVKIDKTDLIAKFKDSPEVVDAINKASDTEKDGLTLLSNLATKESKRGKYDVTVRVPNENGGIDNVVYSVKDRELYGALKDTTPEMLASLARFPLFKYPKKIARIGITENPIFAWAHLMRGIWTHNFTDMSTPMNMKTGAYWKHVASNALIGLPKEAYSILTNTLPTFVRLLSHDLSLRMGTNFPRNATEGVAKGLGLAADKVTGGRLGGYTDVPTLLDDIQLQGGAGAELLQADPKAAFKSYLNKSDPYNRRWADWVPDTWVNYTKTPTAQALHAITNDAKQLLLTLTRMTSVGDQTVRIQNARNIAKVGSVKLHGKLLVNDAMTIAYREAMADFSEQGKMGRNIGKFTNFVAAGTAAMNSEARAFNPLRTDTPYAKKIANYALMANYIGMMYVIKTLWGKDKDGEVIEENIDPASRSLFYHLYIPNYLDPTADGKYIRIPKPPGLLGFAYDSAEMAIDAGIGKDIPEDQVKTLGKSYLGMFPDFTGLAPVAVQTTAGLYANTNPFYNAPLENPSDIVNKVPKELRFSGGSSELGKLASSESAKNDFLDRNHISAPQFDFIVAQLGGRTATDINKKLIDKVILGVKSAVTGEDFVKPQDLYSLSSYLLGTLRFEYQDPNTTLYSAALKKNTDYLTKATEAYKNYKDKGWDNLSKEEQKWAQVYVPLTSRQKNILSPMFKLYRIVSDPSTTTYAKAKIDANQKREIMDTLAREINKEIKSTNAFVSGYVGK